MILLPAIKIVFRYFILSESNCRKIVMALHLTLVLPRVLRARGKSFLPAYMCCSYYTYVYNNHNNNNNHNNSNSDNNIEIQ